MLSLFAVLYGIGKNGSTRISIGNNGISIGNNGSARDKYGL